MKVIIYNFNKKNKKWLDIILDCISDLNLFKYTFSIDFGKFYSDINLTIGREEEKHYKISTSLGKLQMEDFKGDLYDLVKNEIENCIWRLENYRKNDDEK